MAEGDFKSIRRFCERDHANIASWKQLDPPARGHYTAHTATEALTTTSAGSSRRSDERRSPRR
jgi:epoxide hydrolase